LGTLSQDVFCLDDCDRFCCAVAIRQVGYATQVVV